MKIPYLRIFYLPVFFLSVLFSVSCKKSTTATATVVLATVYTPNLIINVTSTTAQSGGIISSEGGGIITANGVCYSATNQVPTVADGKTSDPVGSQATAVETFSSSITGLTAGTTYYLRAYVTNGAGTAYGSVVKFTTSSNLSAVVATVTTFAGSGVAGYADGTGTSAQFNSPSGIAIDANGNLFVSDSYNNYIREITPQGVTTTVAGNGTAGYIDGPAPSAEFYAPRGLTFDTQGNLFVADFGSNVIRKITPSGLVSTYVGNGAAGYTGGSTPSEFEFNSPSGLAFNASGTLYIADFGNNAIRMVTNALVVSTLAGVKTHGFIDGLGNLAAFSSPSDVVTDASGNVYVADPGNFAIRKVTPAGQVTTIAGGTTLPTLINLPAGLAIDKAGDLFIADAGGRVLEITTSNILYVLAGSLNIAGSTDGSGSSALFNSPQAIALDANGNIYVADKNNNVIRKITVAMVPAN